MFEKNKNGENSSNMMINHGKIRENRSNTYENSGKLRIFSVSK